jgi:hypothetical protein
MKKIFSLLIIIQFAGIYNSFAQKKAAADSSAKEEAFKPDTSGAGVAVSPSTLRFNAGPGTTKVQKLTITNDTKKTYKFKLTFSDFDMDNEGNVKTLPPNQYGKYGLSRFVSATPSFVELKPGEKKKIDVTVKIPEDELLNKAMWCILMVDEAEEKKFITPPKAGDNQMSMGVIPIFGFGVYIYNNPPNVKVNKVEITNFVYNKSVSHGTEFKHVIIKAKNTGDGIGFCSSYVELTNLGTGEQKRLLVKKFTILPSQERDFDYILPADLKPGRYSIAGVLDFGSKEEVEAAEMEITIP